MARGKRPGKPSKTYGGVPESELGTSDKPDKTYGAPFPSLTSKPGSDPEVERWFKRIVGAEKVQETWEDTYETDRCYAYWMGKQREEPLDAQKESKAIINLVHPQVRAQIPTLYFYRPFARVSADPAQADTPQTIVDTKAQLLQDTGNYFVRDPETTFRQSTFLALKEHFWAFGCCEVGYSTEFVDAPAQDRPALKESEDDKPEDIGEEGEGKADATVPPGSHRMPDGTVMLDAAMPGVATESPEAEIARLKNSLRSETFYVKFISAKQVLVSASDKAILEQNDWIGYWEDYPLEDVKRSTAYENTEDLKPSSNASVKSAAKDGDKPEDKEFGKDEEDAEVKKIRLYKLWDLRRRRRIVLAQGHKQFLLNKSYKRLPLKFYRPDIDPYHFRPIPPIYNGLGNQDEHNDSYEYLRRTRKQTKSRWTYDEEAVKREEIEKFEKDDVNYIPRKMGTTRPIEPVEHPQYAQLPMQTFTLSERAFSQATGVSPEARQLQTQGEKTATQVTLQASRAQAVDSFDRVLFAEFLGSIIEELVALAIDHMNLERWIQINVDRESPMAMMEAQNVIRLYRSIKAEDLEKAAAGIRWHATVDVESLSPVAEQEQLARFLQMLGFLGNENQAVLLSSAPALLNRLLTLMGLKAAKDQDAIREALAVVVRMAQARAQAGAGQPPGISPMGGSPSPRSPQAAIPQPTPPPGPGGRGVPGTPPVGPV